MFDQYQLSKNGAGMPKDRIIGTEEIIVPFQIIKYVLRDGSGDYVEQGMTINCFVNIFLIDGTQITSSKGNKITKFLLGRKRLIKGLQLGLKKIRKNQKLRLVISPQYAYGGDESIPLILPNSKLVFEIEVISFGFIAIDRMSDTDLYYEVYHFLDKSDKLLKRGQEDEGLFALVKAYKFACKIKHYKCTIVSKIKLKWANILFSRQDYQNSLLILNRIEKNDGIAEDCLRLFISLYKALDRKEDLEKLIETTYEDTLSDKSIKRICVQYYKQTNRERLRKLPGYDFKKDRLIQVKQTEKEKFFGYRLYG